jgi:aminoglycoside phosphotransferase (APT) family kinase protein
LRALAARLSGDPTAAIAFLGEGWDNVVWAVGDHLALRVRKEGTVQQRAVAVQHDVDLLHFARRHSTVAAPTVVAVAPLDGALLVTRVPGVPAAEASPDLAALADTVAELLTALHSVLPEEVADVVAPDPDPAEEWLRQIGEEYAEAREHCPHDLRAGVEAFLAAAPPPPASRLVFCHNDLRDDHLMVDPDSGAVTGLIDWGDAVLGDPALDLATVLADFGPQTYRRVLAGYAVPLEEGYEERVLHVARRRLVEDLAWRVRRHDRSGLERTAAALRPLLLSGR